MNTIQTQQEKPIYVLFQDKKRALIPKTLSLILLSVVFYIGIIINLSLIRLGASQETMIKTISIVILALIILLGIYMAYRKAEMPYRFYPNRVQQGKKKIFYRDVMNTTKREDPIDKFFKTYAINLGNNFHLRDIPKELDIGSYLQQLIQYSRQRRF